jgi:guanine deaminase
VQALKLRARLISFDCDADGQIIANHLDDGVLVCDNGRISQLMSAADYAAQGFALSEIEDLRPCIIFPGFVDTHLHMPQLGIIASYSAQLLDWLERYAFPAESAYADSAYAALQAQTFLDRVVASGTTCAQVFTTVYAHSCEHLFAAAQAKGMALVAGKVMMDRNAPEALTQEAQACIRDCEQLIQKWHGKDRLQYALTPRFAITSTDAQLALCGELLQGHADLLLQTHLSENHEEIAEVGRLFPKANDYLDVYENYGLNTARATFAHGIHLSECERQRLIDAGAKVAFCPSSNLFLGSGLLDMAALPAHNLSIASDVGGGTGLSMLHTCAEGYKVAQLQNQRFHPLQAFYAITAGNAKTLGLAAQIGQLQPGFMADLVILNPTKPSGLGERFYRCEDLTEELFALMMLSDDRSVERCYIGGRLAYGATE